MKLKSTTLFWLLAFVTALVSIAFTTTFFNSPSSNLSVVIKQATTLDEFLGVVKEIADGLLRRHHHHHHHHHSHHHHHHHHREMPDMTCSESKWGSTLSSSYRVSLTITVDLHGCGNFSSVQKAVDAVPDFSSSFTLIILDSGLYKSVKLIYTSIYSKID